MVLSAVPARCLHFLDFGFGITIMPITAPEKAPTATPLIKLVLHIFFPPITVRFDSEIVSAGKRKTILLKRRVLNLGDRICWI